MKSDIPSSAYTTGAVLILLPIIFGFFKASGFFSGNRRIHKTLSLQQLAKKYWSWEAFSMVPFFAFAGGGTYLLYHGLNALARTRQPVLSPDIIHLSTPPFFWLLPAMFLGMILSAFPLMLLLKLTLGDRYHEFECYSDMKAGFNTNRVFGFFGVIITALCLVGIWTGLNFYWRFDPQGFAINPMTEFQERRYSYSDIRELRLVSKVKAPNGNIVNKPYYEIVTNDGERWPSRNGPNEDLKVMKNLFETLAKRSGLQVRRYDLVPETK